MTFQSDGVAFTFGNDDDLCILCFFKVNETYVFNYCVYHLFNDATKSLTLNDISCQYSKHTFQYIYFSYTFIIPLLYNLSPQDLIPVLDLCCHPEYVISIESK